MKHSIIIQRLCLFLLLMASATGAWAESSVLFNSTEQGKNKTVTTLTKSPVTITFDNCKTSGAGNIYEPAKGTGLTISVTSGYRIREIVLEDTEGGSDYNKGGLDRIGAYSDASYSMAFVKNSGSQDDNNNIQFRNYDAPAQSFRIVGHSMSNKGQLKIRRITVVYVQEGNIRFSISSQTLHVGEERRYTYGAITISTSGFANSELTHSVGNSEIASFERINGGTTYALKGLKAGETTLNVKGGPNADVSSAYASIPLYVVRNDLSPSLTWTEKTMKAWEVLKFPTLENMPSDYQIGYDECTYISSDESVVKPNPGNGTLVFGGSGYGKTATISVIIPQNDKYNADTLQYTVTVDNEMRIASKDDWQTLSNQVEAGNTSINATMTADVDLGTNSNFSEFKELILGRNKNYSGTLDGGGHTLSFVWDAGSQPYIAPIYAVENATIKNLRTSGSITSSESHISGMIRQVFGTVTISNCVSNVNITSSYSNGSASIAGLVASVRPSATLNITDCMVTGILTATTDNGKKDVKGFVCNQEGSCTISNSLFAGSGNGHTWSGTFTRNNATLNNCYYLNPCGTAQGTQVTAEQLKSGEVAYLLQNGRTDNVWGQTLATDTVPQLTADAAQHVNKVTFTKDEQPVAARYVNTGKAINGSLPTVQDILGSSYDDHHYYTLAFADDFNASTAVTADKTVAAILTDNEYYEIATKEDWKAFCDLVNGGQTTVDAKLTKNINLGNNIWQVGSSDHKYSGMFDGDGYSITVDWNSTTDELALFYQINGATIRNLHTRGSITTTHYFGSLSGMVWQADGNVALSSCSSMVNLTLAGTGNYRSAGLIGSLSGGASATLTDCIVGGQFSGAEGNARNCWSGFVSSESDASSTLTNCLYIGNNNGYKWCCTFVRKGNISLNNCYYLNACGYDEVQGTYVTEKQLKNGYVTKLLQADRTDKCYWAQQLGEMPSFYDADKIEQTNYVYWRPSDQQWYCKWLYIDGYMPIGIGFYASDATITGTREQGKPFTITLPFDWANDHRHQIYVLATVDKQANIARFSEVKNNSSEALQAYYPYLVIPSVTEYGTVYHDVSIKAEPDKPVAENVNGVQWCATYEGLTNAEAAAAGAYILQGDGLFHKVTTENTNAVIPPYRAYLTIPNALPGKRRLSIAFDNDNTTSLRAIETTDADGTVRYYDLQGRYIGTTLDGQPEGIYVGGGKKVIKK